MAVNADTSQKPYYIPTLVSPMRCMIGDQR